MDVEQIYSLGSHRIVLGWSDAEQSYFARIETNTDEPEILWEFDQRSEPKNLQRMLDSTQINVRSINGHDDFYLARNDEEDLKSAPTATRVDPASLQRLEISDLEYAIDPKRYEDVIAGEAFLSEEEVEHTLCLQHLRNCVDILKAIQRSEDSGAVYDGYGTPESARKQVIAEATAYIAEVACLVSFERIDELRATPFEARLDINDLFNADEIESIDCYTWDLCQSRLTDFPQAIRRGYDPTIGLPLNCPNPDTFNWVDTVPDNAVTLYQSFGLTESAAIRLADIQRTDPRDRSEEDWGFMDTVKRQIASYAEILENIREKGAL